MKSVFSWLLLFGLALLAFACDAPSHERLGVSRSAGSVCGSGSVTFSNQVPTQGTTYGNTVRLSTRVSGTAATPTGTVTFSNGSNVTCSATLGPVSVPAGLTMPLVAEAILDVPSAGCTNLFNAGVQNLTMTYSGDAAYACNQTTSGSFTVFPASPYINVTRLCANQQTECSSSYVYGEPVQFTVGVGIESQGAGVPPGTVTLTKQIGEGSTDLAGPFTLTNGSASIQIANLALGQHDIGARYTPSTANFSEAQTYYGAYVSVGQAASSITNVTAAPSPSTVGQTVKFSAVVSKVDPSNALPIGTVIFYEQNLRGAPGLQGLTKGSEVCRGTSTLLNNGLAECTSSALMAGTHDIYAEFVSTPEFAGVSSDQSIPHTVQDSVGFTLGLSSNATATGTDPVGYTSTYGTPVTFTATITTSAGEPAGDVRFYDLSSATPDSPFATVPLATVGGVTSATTPAQSWVGGVHDVKAVYDGDATHQNPGTCPAGGIIVTCPNLPGTDTRRLTIGTHATQLALSATSASPFPARYGQTVTLTATVQPSPAITSGCASPTGTVTFFNGASSIGTATLSPTGPDVCGRPGTAVLVTALLPVGSAAITATYAPVSPAEPNYAGSSGTLSPALTVNKASTQTTLLASPTTAVVGAEVTLTGSVVVVAPGVVGGTSPTTPSASSLEASNVTFTEGGVTIGTGTLEPTLSTTTRRGWRFKTTGLTVGTHIITAVYATNGNYQASSSGTATILVNQDGVSANITSSQNPSAYGVNVTYTATLTATTGGPPTGTVTFTEGATTIGTATLAGAVASVTQTAPSAGIHTIAVTYSGDANHPAGPLATFTQTVNRAATTTTLASSANPSVAGQTVTLTATVASASPGTIGGTVSFTDGTNVLGTAAVGAGGIAAIDAPALPVGPRPITAVYSGDTNFAPSSAGSGAGGISQVVSKAATALVLSSSTNPSLLGASVSFTATVAAVAPGTGVPTGLVQFTKAGVAIGTATLSPAGTATLTNNTLLLGANAITATYAGSALYTGSSSNLTQNAAANAATIVLTTSPSPATFGVAVTLTATITGGATMPTGSITFKNGSATIGVATIDASGVATFTTRLLPVGTLNLTAVYGGSATYAAGDGSATAVVDKAPTTTTMTSSLNPSKVGDAITFTANVTSTGGTVPGELEVLNGTTVLGTVVLTNGSATYTTNAIPRGAHVITVRYKGTGSFAESSTTLTQTVNVEPDAGTGTSPPGNASSSSGAVAPPAPAADGGSGVGLGSITPGDLGSGGDDCAVAAPGAGSGLFSMSGIALSALAVLGLARRRRSTRATSNDDRKRGDA